MLKIVLLGYGDIAQALILGILKSRHKIVGVLKWERERPNKFTAFLRDTFVPDSLTSIIKANNLYEINAKKANSQRFVKEMKKLKPDVILVGSWGEILKAETIKLPKVACINCHPSMLPKHRGSNPYLSAILSNETKTGLTFHLLNEGVDTGEVLLQREIDILPDDKGGDVKQKCALAAKESVAELLDKLENAQLIPKKQDESQASYYPRVHPNQGKILWHMPPLAIHNHIRAFNPWFKCFTFHNKRFVFINSAKIMKLKTPVQPPGKIIAKTGEKLLISTGDPFTAILAEDVEMFGFMSRLWSKSYIRNVIKVGDFLDSIALTFEKY